MAEATEKKTDGFLSASELLKVRGIKNTAWEDWEQTEFTLPKVGKKHFEPTGSWLQEMQLENGIRNRKRLLEIERVARSSELAVAEWLPGSQKARVTKKSGQKWDCFGYEEKSQLHLLPEEALILMEMNCLELIWNGMPLSIQQAYEVLINCENSKCTLDEYRVYSQLVRVGYRLQRFRDKSSLDNKSSNSTKRIIMNPDGLWTPNTSPTIEKQTSDSNGSTSTSKTSSEQEDDIAKPNSLENGKSQKVPRLGIVSEETVLGNIKIIKNNTSPAKDSSTSTSETSKWPGSRIQRNIKLMPRRSDKMNNVPSTSLIDAKSTETNSSLSTVPEKRSSSPDSEEPPSKKSKPEIIELSDDEIEEIPRPMTRAEILNTYPNFAGAGSELILEIPRAYLPHGVKPLKDFYRYDCQRLMNLTQTDSMLKSSHHQQVAVNNINNSQSSHFYSQNSQCQSITTYNSNNGYSYRGMRCQRDNGSYIQQNVSYKTIHSPYSGTMYQSNYVNFVMEVMGSMVRSFRQQQFQQTTFCQNLQIYSPRYAYQQQQQRFQPYSPVNYYTSPMRDQYGRRGAPSITTIPRGRGYRYNNDTQRVANQDEFNQQPLSGKQTGCNSWKELKRKWREEHTITIDDEEPTSQADTSVDSSEVQVVQESVSPLVDSKTGITSMSEVYERLRIIKSATDRTVRSRRIDYTLSYEVYSMNQPYRKSSPGTPMCRLFILNSRKESFIDASKLQRLQQESKEVPIVVAFVSQSCISYHQPGVVLLPNFS